MSKVFVQSILIISLLVVPAFGVDGDALFYTRGTGEMGWICPVLAESTGYVYLGFAYDREEYWHTGSSVMCFDRDGGEVWTFPISDKDQPCGGFTLNAAEDRLYFGTYERGGDMYCLNAHTGAVIWQSSTALGWPNDTRRFGASPALSADETVLYCGSGGEVWDNLVDQRFYACNALTGQLLWMYEASHDDRQERPDLQALPDSETAGCGFWPDPAVGPDGTIYAGNFNGILYAFNPDGTIKWQYETYWYDETAPPGEERRPSSFSIWHEIWGAPALNSDGSVVYIAGNDWFVHAINASTGQMIWKYECCFNCEETTTTAEIYTNPAVGADGTIYVTSEDNYVYALNPDGTLKWKSDAIYQALTGTGELPVEDSTGVELCWTGSWTLLEDGTMVAGVDTARHYVALNSSNGSLKWLTKLIIDWAEEDDTVEIHTEPVVDPITNRVYGGTGWLGGLVALEESSTLAYSAHWPRSQRDNRSSGYYVSGGPDNDPPVPDPMTWETYPASDTDIAISMTATTAFDPSGVQYYFDETTGGPGADDSGWVSSPDYTDSGLNPSTQYCYQVKARDNSPNQNETGWSTLECETTSALDLVPPNPDPMTWASVPSADSSSAISMTATTATDPSGVQYYFDETTGNPGGDDSSWQDNSNYTDAGLSPSTQYCYQVKARDKSSNQNETGWSTNECATTITPEWLTLTSDDFETGMGNYTDGGNNCEWVQDGDSCGAGPGCVKIRAKGKGAVFYHTNSFDVNSNTEIRVSFHFYVEAFSDGEDFWLQFYDGTDYQTVKAYVFGQGGDYEIETHYDDTVIFNNTEYNFPTDMKIQFRCDASSLTDEAWIDDLVVEVK